MIEARTDLVAYCFECTRRIPAHSSCVACGGTDLGRFDDPAVLSRLREGRSRPPPRRRWLVFHALAFTAMAVSLGLGMRYGRLQPNPDASLGTLVMLGVLPAFVTWALCIGALGPHRYRSPRQKKNQAFFSATVARLLERRSEAFEARLATPIRFLPVLLAPPALMALAVGFSVGPSEGATATLSLTLLALAWTVPAALATVSFIELCLMNPLIGGAFLLPVGALIVLTMQRDGAPGELIAVWAVASFVTLMLLTDAARCAHRWAFDRLRREPFPLDPMPLDEGPEGVSTLSGRARSDSPLLVPSTGEPCVGFVVSGETGRGRVRDAAFCSFWVDPAGGASAVRIDAEHAHITVEAGSMCSRKEARSGLDAFLRDRGLPEAAGELSVGVIRDGDLVEVSGTLEARPPDQNYRDGRGKSLLRGSPSAPLRIRLPSKPS